MNKFTKMVEDLEENEDIVECKECFDLFPKAECSEYEAGGYICPTCKGMVKKASFRPNSRDITVDLYDQEFPEVSDYDDGFVSKPATEDTLSNAFDALVRDEYEAVDAYDAAVDAVDEMDFETAAQKKAAKKTLKHIRDEEEEHIDELKEITSDDPDLIEDEDEEQEDLDELFSGANTKPAINSTVAPVLNASLDAKAKKDAEVEEGIGIGAGLAIAGGAIGAGNVISSLMDSKKSPKGEEELDELFDIELDARGFGGSGNDVHVGPGSLTSSLEDEKEEEKKPLNESTAKVWTCWYEGKDIGTVEAETEEEAREKMMVEYPFREYNNTDWEVTLGDGEDETLTEGPLFRKIGRGLKSLGDKVKKALSARDAKDFGKILGQVFVNGYTIFARDAAKKPVTIPNQFKTTFTADEFDKAKAEAQRVSKALAGAQVFLLAAGINKADYGVFTQKHIVIQGKHANTIAVFKDNKAIKDDTKTLADKFFEAIKDDGESAAAAEDTSLGDESEEETTPTVGDSEVEDEVAVADGSDKSGKGEGEADPEEEPKKEEPKTGYAGHNLSKKAVQNFRKMMRLMGLKVYDAFDKPVGTDAKSLGSITAENLVDYEIEVDGKKVSLVNWLTTMVKNGVIAESFATDLCGKTLYESFDDSYDDFGDFEDEFEDDTVVCAWCGQDFPKAECRKEVDMGYLCNFCEQAIKSRGETLTFEE